jgi:hypothetical protein
VFQFGFLYPMQFSTKNLPSQQALSTSAALRGSVKRSRALDSMVLSLSHTFGGSLTFTSLSTTVCFAGGGAGSLTYSSDDFTS